MSTPASRFGGMLPTNLPEATLCFDVLFEADFQFVLGGKLHGLGPLDDNCKGMSTNRFAST